MPNWSGGILTTKGQALQAKVDAGQTTLTITKMKIGSGIIASGQNLQSLNDLVVPEINVPISAVSAEGNISTIIGVITNTGVINGFNVRELGVFAQDPVLGEILYAITTDSAPDYLPPEGGSVTVSSEYSYNIVVSNAANVTAVLNPSGLVTVSILNQKILEHDSDENAHNEAIEKHNTSAIAHADLLHIWQSTKEYIKGDICFPAGSSYPSWMILECTTSGTSAATEPTWGSTVGAEITDNTAAWRVKNLISGSGVSIGTVMPHLTTTAPAGWLALDTGALVSRTTYAELWTWVQSHAPLVTEAAWQAQAAVQSSVGAYSSGDGSTTFRLPRIVDFVRGSNGVRLSGTWQDDDFEIHSHVERASAPSTSTTYALTIDHGSTGQEPLDMSYSTGSTGGTETRPKNISMLYCVKAFDATTNQGLIDITALANEVADKQNKLQYALIVDEKATGAAADSIAAGGWRTRVLNTVKYNTNNFVSLSNNQITISTPGTFVIRAVIPTGACDYSKCRIRNITDSSTIATCTDNATQGVSDGVTVRGGVVGVVTISESKVFEINHYTSVTTTGGITYAAAGDVETYTTVEITKID